MVVRLEGAVIPVTTRRATPLIVALALALTSACGNASEKIVERAIEGAADGDVNVDLNRDGEGGFSIETPDGSMTVGMAEIPDEWPDDIPLPPGFEVTSGTAIADGSSGQYVAVTGSADLSPAELEEFYASALSDWGESARFATSADGGQMVNITYESDGRTFLIGINTIPDDELISLTYSAGS